jgi:glycosyltransferase involved in cell wall biosynthesis
MLKKAAAQLPQDKLTLIEGTVDADAYERLLRAADIVLLPYAKEFYGWASSGIFAESMSLGKVIVAAAGTWPAQQLEKFGGGGVIIKTLDAAGIAEAIGATVRSLTPLRERAAAAVPAWRAHHSAASFVDKLLALAA